MITAAFSHTRRPLSCGGCNSWRIQFPTGEDLQDLLFHFMLQASLFLCAFFPCAASEKAASSFSKVVRFQAALVDATATAFTKGKPPLPNVAFRLRLADARLSPAGRLCFLSKVTVTGKAFSACYVATLGRLVPRKRIKIGQHLLPVHFVRNTGV